MTTEESIQDPAEARSRFLEVWHMLKGNSLALSGMIIFVLFFFIALSGLFLTYGQEPILNPSKIRLQEKLRPPLSEPNLDTLSPDEVPALGIYLLGTDDLGRDVFARMLQGAWVSLTVGFVAVGIAVLVGIFMGGIAGFFGQLRMKLDWIIVISVFFLGLVFVFAGATSAGAILLITGILVILISFIIKKTAWGGRSLLRWRVFFRRGTISIDTIVMRLVDIMLCFPSFFLILTVVALLPASLYNIMIVIGLTSWMGTTRFVRAEFLSLREQDFVSAARALGVGNFRIIFRHMMPNAIAPVLVSATIGIATAILTEAGLSFLGFGVPPPHATWGNILSDGKRFIFDAPWLTFVPGMAILIVVLSFNLFGEGLRDILNPRLREGN